MLSNYKKYDKKRYHLTYTLTDFSMEYCKEYPKDLSKSEYIRIMIRFFKLVRDEIIYNKFHFKLPNGLGLIRIRKSKKGVTARKIDFNKSKLLNKKIYYLNLHSNRYFFKWYWNKTKEVSLAIPGRKLYVFKPIRWGKKDLAKHIIECAKNPEVRDYDCLQ